MEIETKKYGMKTNVGKTKVMGVNSSENMTGVTKEGKMQRTNTDIWVIC